MGEITKVKQWNHWPQDLEWWQHQEEKCIIKKHEGHWGENDWLDTRVLEKQWEGKWQWLPVWLLDNHVMI